MCILQNSKYNDQYNVIKWDSVPYTIQKGQDKNGHSIGDLVVETAKLNPIPSANSWFTVGLVQR